MGVLPEPGSGPTAEEMERGFLTLTGETGGNWWNGKKRRKRGLINILGGGFQDFFIFIPIWGNDSQFDDHIFQMS